MDLKKLLDWGGIFGGGVSIVAAGFSMFGAIWTAEINTEGAKEVARIQNEGALDNKMVEWAMLVMQNPKSSVPERKWAVDILCTWNKVNCPPERREEIARSRQSLAEIGETVPEAKILNEKLDGSRFWRDLHTVPDLYQVPDLHAPKEGGGDTQIEQTPAKSESNQR